MCQVLICFLAFSIALRLQVKSDLGMGAGVFEVCPVCSRRVKRGTSDSGTFVLQRCGHKVFQDDLVEFTHWKASSCLLT